MSFWTQATATIVWTAAVCGVFWVCSERSWQRAQPDGIVLQAPPLSNLDKTFINIVSLGHTQLYEDFLTAWMIQLSAERRLSSEQYDQLGAMFREIGGIHRPRLESFYLLGCFTLALDGKKPELCIDISKIGLFVFTESWRIPMMQGYIDGFKLKNYPRAANFYYLASTREKSPEYVRKVAIKMLNHESVTQDEIEETMRSIVNLPNRSGFKQFVDEARVAAEEQKEKEQQKTQESNQPPTQLPSPQLQPQKSQPAPPLR